MVIKKSMIFGLAFLVCIVCSQLAIAQTYPSNLRSYPVGPMPTARQQFFPKLVGNSVVIQDQQPQKNQDLIGVPNPPASGVTNVPAQPGLEVASNAEYIDEAEYRRNKRRCRRCGGLRKMIERRRAQRACRAQMNSCCDCCCGCGCG